MAHRNTLQEAGEVDEKRILLVEKFDGFPENIVFPEINEKIRTDLSKIVSFSENIYNTHQLFEIFLFNVDQLFDFCTLYYNDQIVRKKDGCSVSLIEINALLINIISAGKTLIDKVESFLKTELGEDRVKIFKDNCISKKYDEVFSYRFLYHLRNFAQHGSLPVSQKPKEKFCFDLFQISSAKHTHFSASIRESMNNIQQDIVKRFKDEPHIAVTYTLDAYTMTVLDIYNSFFYDIESDVLAYHNLKIDILRENPEIVFHGNETLNNMVIYEVEESTLHMLRSPAMGGL